MNTYKPLLLVTVDKDSTLSSIVIREYTLFHLDLSKMMLSGKYKSVEVVEPVQDLYNGFFIQIDDTHFVAHDMRVNEGILFSADTLDDLHTMIDSCLHDLALEEQKERDRKIAQLEREKKRAS